jgi:hypothetical protein
MLKSFNKFIILMRELARLCLILALGIGIGFLLTIPLLSLLPLQPYLRKPAPGDFPGILLRTFFVAAFLFQGGVFSCLAELVFYERGGKLYQIADLPWDPLYQALSLLKREFKKVGRFYRSCYLSLFAVPLVGIFLIGFIFGFYLGIFSLVLGARGAFLFLQKLFPHALIEIPVYLIAARFGVEMARQAEEEVMEERKEELRLKLISALKSRENWKRIFFLYLLLTISSYLEVFS